MKVKTQPALQEATGALFLEERQALEGGEGRLGPGVEGECAGWEGGRCGEAQGRRGVQGRGGASPEAAARIYCSGCITSSSLSVGSPSSSQPKQCFISSRKAR